MDPAPSVILAVETAVPEHVVGQDEVQETAAELFAEALPDLGRLLAVFAHAGIRRRRLAVPLDWYRRPHDFGEKNRLYIEHAGNLGAAACGRCLAAAGVRPEEIDAFILISSTGVAAPSLDAHLIGRLAINPHVQRTPVWGLGCAGGAAGLARAHHYAQAHPDAVVLLLAVELCGLTFQHRDRSKSNLVASALFADGAAAVLIAGQRAAERIAGRRESGAGGSPGAVDILGGYSTTWPETLDVMGWEVSGDGLHVLFSRQIPAIVRRRMRGNVAEFLNAQGLGLDAVDAFLLHPGGARVLDAYAAALDLSGDDLALSRKVLGEYGNMSSPTVLFILQEWLQAPAAKPGEELALLAALGPGFSSEQVLLRRRPAG